MADDRKYLNLVSRYAFDDGQVSSTIASHRSFTSQVPSSAKNSGSGTDRDVTGFNSTETLIPPHPVKARECMDEEWSKRPFFMPPDEEVFRIRSLDKKKEKKRFKNMLPVAEKTTFSNRMAATVASEALKKELAEIDTQVLKEMNQLKASTILPLEHYHKEKENMAEFIAKKRKNFLAQMSLDNKKAEIRKLEDRAFQREEALQRSEEMLADDKLQFEAFLKQNDQKVQEAIKRAEQQTRLKQDKLAEIKRLNATMATIKKDLNKFQEQLDECKKYKDFLVGLTPKEWLDEKLAIQTHHFKEQELRGGIEAEQLRSKMEIELKGNEAGDEQELEEVETKLMEPMYFKTPHQLLGVFNDLEEKNLALMQESQDIESTLEDLKTRFNDTKAKNDSKITSLRSQLDALKVAVKNEDESQRNLQMRTNVNMVDKKYDVPFEDLSAKVTEVYAKCGLEIDPTLGTVQMLTSIEAPIPKKIGKPKMFRSYLSKKKKQEIQVVRSDDDKELIEFLARDL